MLWSKIINSLVITAMVFSFSVCILCVIIISWQITALLKIIMKHGKKIKGEGYGESNDRNTAQSLAIRVFPILLTLSITFSFIILVTPVLSAFPGWIRTGDYEIPSVELVIISILNSFALISLIFTLKRQKNLDYKI